jgi:hypothetical protein
MIMYVTNLTAAPDPAHPGDYNDQYAAAVQRIDPVDRLPNTTYMWETILSPTQEKETL